MKARQNMLTGAVLAVGLVTLVPMVRTLPLVSVGVIVFAALILTCFLFPQAMVNKESFLFLIYALYIAGSLYFKGFLVKNQLVNLVYWGMALCLANALLYLKNKLIFKTVAWGCLGMVVVTCIFTSQQVLIDPSVVRSGGIVEADFGESPLKVAGYAFAHGVPLLFPYLVYWVKKSDFKIKAIWVFVLGAVSFFILKANFGASLIVSFFCILLSFLITSDKTLNIVLLVTMMLVAALFLNKSIVLSSLQLVEPFFEETVIANKISDIKGSIIASGVEGSVYNRGALYLGSWKAFLGSPLFGVTYRGDAFIGGHSFVLDNLAIGGLSGFSLLVLIIWGMFKRLILIIDKNKRIYFLISLSVFVILNCVKANIGGGSLFILFVVVPALSFAHYKPNIKGVVRGEQLEITQY